MESLDDVLDSKLEANGIKVAYKNIALVLEDGDEDTYREIRRMGFGASESSKLLGVNPFPNGNLEDVITEKKTGETDKSISYKPSVRKGKDLEPMLIQRTIDSTGFLIIKPANMYIDETTGLTVNFDGVVLDDEPYPMEFKLCTKYGRKYYDFSKAVCEYADLEEGDKQIDLGALLKAFIDKTKRANQPDLPIKKLADYYGIPVYYYTQLQQQMYFCNSKIGILAVMDDDNWAMNYFIIPRNDNLINKLRAIAYAHKDEIKG